MYKNIGIILLNSLVCCLCVNKPIQGAPRPNILIIYVDDLGYGDLGCYGGDIPTPSIDRLAGDGVRFTSFYVSAPACTPSRYSLLTGSYPQRSIHGLTNALMPVDTNYLDESEVILAEYLKADGYKTGIFGKWHLGFADQSGSPEMHGFDRFAGFKGGCIDFFTHVYGQMGHDWFVDGEESWEEGYSTDLITDHALKFMKEMEKQPAPFFTYLSYNAPHYGKTDPDTVVEHTVTLSEGVYHGYGIINSLQAPSKYVQRFAHIEDPYRKAYKAMVACLDENIGRVLDYLNQADLMANTMIWFISDNGGYSIRHYGHADNGGLRGEKGTIWEGGIRVPALLQWKGQVPAHHVIEQPICNTDILPTLLSLLQIPALPKHHTQVDGLDISDVIFRGRKMERNIYWKYNDQSAFREGHWKLVNQTELYDLGEDPYESVNLAKAYPDVVRRLRDLYVAKCVELKVIP